MAHCQDEMGWPVCLLVFRWLIVTTPCVGLCVCMCSVGSLSRRHLLVCVFVCVLMAHCHDAIGRNVCFFVFCRLIFTTPWVGMFVCLCSDGSLS